MKLAFWANPASTAASHMDALMTFVFLVVVFFCFLIAFLIIYFSIRYHYRTPADRSRPITNNLTIEIIWTAIPLALVLIMFVWGARLFVRMRQAPPGALEIYVVGKQWMWKIQHPQGPRQINELHVPVGRPIRLIMISEDVIHSFYIPEFHVKQDVLPGRYTTQWFQATRPGRYRLLCSQYCGTSHSQMIGWVTAMEPAAYEQWLGGPPPPYGGYGAHSSMASRGDIRRSSTRRRMAEAGQKLFERLGCATCHLPDQSGLGPPLIGLHDRSYIRESILKPLAKITKGYEPIMPSFEGQVSEEDISELVAYIKSLNKSTGVRGK